jgi:hypothetical protein
VHRLVEGIERLGPIERYGQKPVAALEQDGVEGGKSRAHVASLPGIAHGVEGRPIARGGDEP